MSKGLSTLFETAIMALVMAALVLLGGIAYGVYMKEDASPAPEPENASEPASTELRP